MFLSMASFELPFFKHRTFWKKFLVFLGLLLCSGVFCFKMNVFLFRRFVYEVPKDKTTLITGNSFINCGIDPLLVDSSVNIGMAAEPLSVSFYKLRVILDRNPHIKNVVVSFSVANLGPCNDSLFNREKSESVELLTRIVPLVADFNEIDALNPSSNVKMEVLFRELFFFNYIYWSKLLVPNNNYGYVGAYLYGKIRQKTVQYKDTSCYARIASGIFPVSNKGEALLSKMMICYVDSIVRLTKKHHVDLYLLGMPLYFELAERIPRSYVLHHRMIVNRIVEANEHVRFFDMTLNRQLNKDCYRNVTHLNHNGAAIVSKELDRLLKEVKSDRN